MGHAWMRTKNVECELRDEGWEVVGEAELIDPYFERGPFVLPAPLGWRSKRRAWIREMAATHKPPLHVSVTSGLPDGRFNHDVMYVVVI